MLDQDWLAEREGAVDSRGGGGAGLEDVAVVQRGQEGCRGTWQMCSGMKAGDCVYLAV